MDKDKRGGSKDAERAAAEGDYTDPRKSREVDWAYDPGYLKRRQAFVKQAKARVRRRRMQG